MPARLLLAEELFDLRSGTEFFQGRESETPTGRVLLHAMHGGNALGGRESDGLALVAEDWEASYLPHLSRCLPCARKTGDCSRSGLQLLSPADVVAPPPGLPATGVDIRTAHGSERERQGSNALRAALADYDLRRYLLTDVVTVNEEIRGGFSHPLTLSPRMLLRLDPHGALSVFLHEQMHWIHGPGLDAATTEAAMRWPDPPPPPAGSYDAQSSWLHISVCSLEYVSLAEVIGEADAVAALRGQQHYRWMYEQILADPAWARDLLGRHGLSVPAAPPVPRRYYGPDWWASIPGVLDSPAQEAT
jgi:hypothetical protein